MKKHLKYLLSTIICVTGLYNIGYSQAIHIIKKDKGSEMKLEGTSSMHDWEMEANTSTGKAQFIFKQGNMFHLDSIKSLSFAIKVSDLKSDSDGLNKNAYDALKSNKYKDICYSLTSSALSPEKGGFLITSVGNLVIAGVTKEITMDVHSSIGEDGTITCSGSYQLNMLDYKVEPPSFMWGAMKTGEQITLDFTVTYEKEKGV
ncbi:MAG: hypothetical protein ACJAVY_002023 [Marinoscillum sp.]|jgi:hypothetical protein